MESLIVPLVIIACIVLLVIISKNTDGVERKKPISIGAFNVLSVITLVLGIVSSIAILFTLGITEDRSVGVEFNGIGMLSSIATLVITLLIYFGCRILVGIATKAEKIKNI